MASHSMSNSTSIWTSNSTLNATSFRTQAIAGTPAFDQDLCPGLLRECCYRAHGLAPRAHERRVERRLARDFQGRQEAEEARSRTGK